MLQNTLPQGRILEEPHIYSLLGINIIQNCVNCGGTSVACSEWSRIQLSQHHLAFLPSLKIATSNMYQWRRKWQLIPVFLPGESQGQRSLVGCRLWGRTESDTTEETQWQQQYVSKDFCLYTGVACMHCWRYNEETNPNEVQYPPKVTQLKYGDQFRSMDTDRVQWLDRFTLIKCTGHS